MSQHHGLVVSQEAAVFLKSQFSSQGKEVLGLRVDVTKAGCSGYEYVLDFAKEVRDTDSVFEDRGIKVIVDTPTFEKFLKGATITYTLKGIQAGIHFDNPNVEAECGCGESFTLKGETKD